MSGKHRVLSGKPGFLLLAVMLLATAGRSDAQQLPIYSQYLFNKFLINPAVAGSDGYTSINLTAREQWLGYYGAPRTVSLSAQGRLLKRRFSITSRSRRNVFRPGSDGKVGIGGYVFSDRNGLIQRTGFQTSYSYHIWIQQQTQLSFGLALTGYHFKINEREIEFEDSDEPWMTNDLRRGIFVPDATFGAHIMNPNFTAGFSAEQLFQSLGKIGSDAYANFKMLRHYYLFGDYTFKTGFYTELQPSFLFRMSEQVKPQADIGLMYIYKKEFWTGINYRTGNAVIANVGVQYQNFFFGYSFDFTLQEIQSITYGTHEISIALKYGDPRRKYRWLDRY
ncbi:MAG: type IX secretion system membrane protein PorP/SprF [Bacteroidales bacterium]|nr:type IX secretion system membrane protein PorP/SprF [Bacteroidales bacterium]